jgi:hypothetical protein
MSRRRSLFGIGAVGLGLALAPVAAEAKGCIKGAIIGGAAGHFTVHHGLLGAAAGCIIGRREANRRKSMPSRLTHPQASGPSGSVQPTHSRPIQTLR